MQGAGRAGAAEVAQERLQLGVGRQPRRRGAGLPGLVVSAQQAGGVGVQGFEERQAVLKVGKVGQGGQAAGGDVRVDEGALPVEGAKEVGQRLGLPCFRADYGQRVKRAARGEQVLHAGRGV